MAPSSATGSACPEPRSGRYASASETPCSSCWNTGTPPSPTDHPLRSHCIGASHVAFQVADIRAAKADLESAGVEFYSDINVVDEGVLAGWRWVYFSDPDGYPLELVENAYERPGGHAAGIAHYLQARPEITR
jgi:hypothetical protein